MAESESGLNSNAVGRPNSDKSRDYGIFQVRTQFSRCWIIMNILIRIELLFINLTLMIMLFRVKQCRRQPGNIFSQLISHTQLNGV
jgi:hypothetical protein